MNQMNLPTLVTSTRLLAVPLVMIGLTWTPWSPWLTLSFFLAAAWTDWLDGYLARKLQQETELGKFLDPLVDKLLVIGPMMSLVEQQVIPAWGVFIIIARDLIISGWRVNQTTVTGANQWGKWKTVVQLSAIAGLLVPTQWIDLKTYSVLTILKQTGLILFWISIPLTILSALIYLWPSITGAVQGQSQEEE